MQPRVDILLATYNGRTFLSEQIESLLKQSYPHLHIFIRDDGSHDGTEALLQEFAEKFPQKITLLPSTPDCTSKGVVQNFSLLLGASEAPYIMCADQDDVWLPTKVADTLQKMQEMEQELGTDTPLLIHTDLTVVDKTLRLRHPSFWKYSRLSVHAKQFSRLLMQNLATGCTMMLNRTLAVQAHPIPVEAVMHDWWIALTAAALGSIGEVKKPTMLYRQHDKNQLGAKDRRLGAIFTQDIPALLTQARRTFQAQEKQAHAFHTRFAPQLSVEQRKILQAFLALPYTPFFRRVYLIGRYKLYKQGMLRNLFFYFISPRKRYAQSPTL